MCNSADHPRVNRRGEADARFAEPSKRLVTIELEQSEIDLDEVRLDSLQIDLEPAATSPSARRRARAWSSDSRTTW